MTLSDLIEIDGISIAVNADYRIIVLARIGSISLKKLLKLLKHVRRGQ